MNPTGQWVDGGLLISGYQRPLRMVTQGKIRALARPPQKEEAAGAFDGILPGIERGADSKPFVWEGDLHVNEQGEKGTRLLRCRGGLWTEVARLEHMDADRQPTLYPLRNNRFLVLAPPAERAPGKDKPAPFGTYRLNGKGCLEVLDLGSFKPLPFEANATLQQAVNQPEALVFTEDELILCCPSYGLFWVFSLENGALRRTIELYDEKLTAPLLKSGENALLVLHMQPLIEGTILISALPPETAEALVSSRARFWKDARAVAPRQGSSPEQYHSYGVFFSTRERELRTEHPFVAWYELDPRTGSVTRRNPPPPGARSLREPKDEDFFWLVDAEGRVTHCTHGLSHLEPETAPKVKAEPTKPHSRRK